MMRSRNFTRNFTKVSWKCPSRLFIHSGVRRFSSDGPHTARSHSTPPQLPSKKNFEVESDENDMEKRLESLGNWIQENGALFGHKIGILDNGLFASKEVLAGETLIAVPKSLCFTRENVLKPANLKDANKKNFVTMAPLAAHLPWPKSLKEERAPYSDEVKLSDDYYIRSIPRLRERALVALCMMHEYVTRGTQSKWAPWFDLLPRPPKRVPVAHQKGDEKGAFIGGPTLDVKWLEELQGTEAFDRIIDMKIDHDFAWDFARAAYDVLPRTFKRTPFKRHLFDHFMMLSGRGYHGLPPAIELVADSGTDEMANVEAISFEAFNSSGPTHFTALRALRDITPGEELRRVFEMPAAELFARHSYTRPFGKRDGLNMKVPMNISSMAGERSKNARVPLPPTARHLKYDSDLAAAYEEGKTWQWFCVKSEYDTAEMCPGGSHRTAWMGHSVPTTELLEAVTSEEALAKDPVEYDYDAAVAAVEARLERLPFSMGADAAWLQAFYERERAYLKSEFAFLFDKDFDAELLPFPKDTLEKFPMPPEAEKLWAGPEVKKLASGAKQIAAPPFLPPKNRQSLQQSLDSGGHLRPAYNLEKSNILAERPDGHLDNVAAPTEDDKIKRDIVYMRLMEKQLLLWHLEHLKQRKTKVLEELRSSELQAMTPNSMLPSLQDTSYTRRWISAVQRWVHPGVREKFGIVDFEEDQRRRERFRRDEQWRKHAIADTELLRQMKHMSPEECEHINKFQKEHLVKPQAAAVSAVSPVNPMAPREEEQKRVYPGDEVSAGDTAATMEIESAARRRRLRRKTN
eukprot:61552_1